jgi:four helix bundle protein
VDGWKQKKTAMMDETKNLMDLIAWQRAMDLIPEVYKAVRMLPPEEKYAMGDQMRRAVVSVPANIAEGHGRHYPREFFQYLGIAKGSLAELETLLLAAHRLGYLDADFVSHMRELIGNVRRPLHGLVERLRLTKAPHEIRAIRTKPTPPF